jgi:hypothetical protein
MVGWFHVSGPVVRQYIMATGCGRRILFTSCQPGSRAEQEMEEARARYGPPGHFPGTHFLQPGPTFHSSTTLQQSIQILNPPMDQNVD